MAKDFRQAVKHAASNIMAKASYAALDFDHALGVVDIQCAFDMYMQDLPNFLADHAEFPNEVHAAIKTLGWAL